MKEYYLKFKKENYNVRIEQIGFMEGLDYEVNLLKLRQKRFY